MATENQPDQNPNIPRKATVFNLFEFLTSFSLFLAGWIVLLVNGSVVGIGLLLTSIWLLTLTTTYRKLSYQMAFLIEVAPVLKQIATKLRVL